MELIPRKHWWFIIRESTDMISRTKSKFFNITNQALHYMLLTTSGDTTFTTQCLIPWTPTIMNDFITPPSRTLHGFSLQCTLSCCFSLPPYTHSCFFQICYFILFFYDWHVKSCTYLMCTTWCVWGYVHTPESITTVKAIDISITS